jgi:CheY-like chemotaxis protein
MTRVLVVDDEIDTLNLLRTILEISGYQAFTTLNSVEAITLAEVEHVDCILLDIMMPQLDGFTLCKMMRLHPATMHLPIVFVTAYSALDLEERRLEAGADMVLPKPIGMDALIDAVEKSSALRAAKVAESKLLAAKPTPEAAPAASIVPPVEIKPDDDHRLPAAATAPAAVPAPKVTPPFILEPEDMPVDPAPGAQPAETPAQTAAETPATADQVDAAPGVPPTEAASEAPAEAPAGSTAPPVAPPVPVNKGTG